MLKRIIDGIKERTPPMRRAPRQPVYMKEAYVNLLRRHYRDCGLAEPEWLDQIPDPPPVPDVASSDPEPKVTFIDDVTVKLVADEDSGCVRIQLCTAFADLYDAYYTKGLQPPIEELVRAHNRMGYSEKYLIKLLSQHDARLARVAKVDLDKIFKCDSGSKTRAKKKQMVRVREEEHDVDAVDDDEEEEEEEREEDDDEDPFDVEVNDDDEDMLVDDQVEDEEAYESE